MKTFFKNLSIQKIEFQSNNPEVSLWCSHEIDDQIIKNNLIIDQSELNRLVGKIQQITQKMDFFNFTFALLDFYFWVNRLVPSRFSAFFSSLRIFLCFSRQHKQRISHRPSHVRCGV